MQKPETRAAMIAVVGRPSTGKSTLVNALCGHHVSIVAPSPQTTRNAIRGILTEERGQIVLVDTPGFHVSERRLNRMLTGIVSDALQEVDAILYLVDSARPPGAEERELARMVAAAAVPVILGVTKLDVSGGLSAAHRAFVAELTAAGESWTGPVELRALHVAPADDGAARRGLSELRDALFSVAPVHPPLYPPEYYTDQEPSFRIAEIVRERAIASLREELPHALLAEVTNLEADEARIVADVAVVVERDSQKGIVIGHKGSGVARIRKESQAMLREIFERPVTLRIQVKVRKDWRTNEATLRRTIG